MPKSAWSPAGVTWISIRQLAWQFDQFDVSRGEVHVKVFGGTAVVGIGAAAKPAIGKLNSEAAIAVLEAEGSKIGKAGAEDVIDE